MAKERKAQHNLRGIDGGKSKVRRTYEEFRANGALALDVPVITVLSPDDEAYAAEIARLVREG